MILKQLAMKTRVSSNKKVIELPPIFIVVFFLSIILGILFPFIKSQKKTTEEKFVVEYVRRSRGLSMADCKKILNKNGLYYSDHEVELVRNVLELLAEMHYKKSRLISNK